MYYSSNYSTNTIFCCGKQDKFWNCTDRLASVRSNCALLLRILRMETLIDPIYANQTNFTIALSSRTHTSFLIIRNKKYISSQHKLFTIYKEKSKIPQPFMPLIPPTPSPQPSLSKIIPRREWIISSPSFVSL